MVFVLGKNKQPLMPCSEKRARLLLQRGRARVHRMAPFTIRLVDRTRATSVTQPIALKLDPGSKTTGIALARIAEASIHPTALIELEHRGLAIRDALKQRAGFRKRRRSVNLRYRQPRFDNRRRPEGWLAPSLQHRVDTIMAWVARLRHLAPVSSLAQELVRFDMQAMQNRASRASPISRGPSLGTKCASICSRNGIARALTALRRACRCRSSMLFLVRPGAPTASRISHWPASRAIPPRALSASKPFSRTIPTGSPRSKRSLKPRCMMRPPSTPRVGRSSTLSNALDCPLPREAVGKRNTTAPVLASQRPMRLTHSAWETWGRSQALEVSIGRRLRSRPPGVGPTSARALRHTGFRVDTSCAPSAFADSLPAIWSWRPFRPESIPAFMSGASPYAQPARLTSKSTQVFSKAYPIDIAISDNAPMDTPITS